MKDPNGVAYPIWEESGMGKAQQMKDASIIN